MPIRLLLLVGAAALLFGAAAPVSHARTACVDDILDEWVHPSKSIATTHPLKCYDLALKEAPEDVLLYTNFETDVRSAKRIALRAERTSTSASGTASPSTATAPRPPGPPPPSQPAPAAAPANQQQQPAPPQGSPQQQNLQIEPEQPAERTLDAATIIDPLVLEAEAPIEEVVPIDEPVVVVAEPIESQAVDAPVIDALRSIGPNDAGSVPLPLIVLTVISGLLAIIGAALLAARHVRAKRLAEAPPLPRSAGSSSNDPTV